MHAPIHSRADARLAQIEKVRRAVLGEGRPVGLLLRLNWPGCGLGSDVAWRALSGILASNAVGTVSFAIGSGVTKDILACYQRCIRNRQAAINFGFTGG